MLTPTSPATGTANRRTRSRRPIWAGWLIAALLLGSGSASAQVTPDYVFNYSFHWRDATPNPGVKLDPFTPINGTAATGFTFVTFRKNVPPTPSLPIGAITWNDETPGELANYLFFRIGSSNLEGIGGGNVVSFTLRTEDDLSELGYAQFNLTLTNTVPVLSGLTTDIGQGENNVALSLLSTASDADGDDVYLTSFSATAVTGYGSLIADPANTHGVIFVRDPNAPLTGYTSTFSYVYNDLWQDSLSGTITLNVAAIPEPGHAAALVAAVMLAVALWRRKRPAATT